MQKRIHAIVKSGDKEEIIGANETGVLVAQTVKPDTIILLFEWCPEKRFVFKVPGVSHNYFQFRLEPSIMDVLFEDFHLQLTDGELTGPHPMGPAKSFHYKKAGY